MAIPAGSQLVPTVGGQGPVLVPVVIPSLVPTLTTCSTVLGVRRTEQLKERRRREGCEESLGSHPQLS